jgi:hypothetical protein
MLVFICSLLNREYNLINVLKALASIFSMCNFHVILLSKVIPRYFTLFTNGIFRPFNGRRESGSFRWTLYRTPIGSLENAVLCCVLFTKQYHSNDGAVLLRVCVAMGTLLQSNEHLQISTAADQLLMFATCGRILWEALTDIC